VQVVCVDVGGGVVIDVGVGDDVIAACADVEEVPEVDRLTVGDERFGHVGDHVELAMPQRHVDVGVGERFDEGQARLEDDDAARRVWMEPGVGIGDPATDVMPAMKTGSRSRATTRWWRSSAMVAAS
jgi:hypothetical protein